MGFFNGLKDTLSGFAGTVGKAVKSGIGHYKKNKEFYNGLAGGALKVGQEIFADNPKAKAYLDRAKQGGKYASQAIDTIDDTLGSDGRVNKKKAKHHLMRGADKALQKGGEYISKRNNHKRPRSRVSGLLQKAAKRAKKGDLATASYKEAQALFRK
jgi:hypothetical protein